MINDGISKKAVIIGSGIGGLSSGILLAMLDYDVTIIEKNRDPGGMMRSYVRRGFDCPVGIHYLGSMGKDQPLGRILDYMGITDTIPLERMGGQGVIDRYIFDDFSFDLPEGVDHFEHNLKEAFPGDAAAITEIMKTFRLAARAMDTLDFVFSADPAGPMQSYFIPLSEYLMGLNCSAGLMSVFGATCGWTGVPSSECPVLYHHMALATYLFSSWRLACTGADFARFLALRFKELGGNLILGDEVKNIIVNSRIVEGVQLKSGNRIMAPLVVSTVHPKIMLGMLQEDALKPSYKLRVGKLQDTEGIFSVNLAVDAKEYSDLPYNIFKVASDPTGTMTDATFIQIRKTHDPQRNLLTLLCGSHYEKWKKWEHTKTGRRGPEYEALKKEESAFLIKQASCVLGPLPRADIIDSYTPLTVRDWVNSPCGSPYGVKKSVGQIASGPALNRTSIKGLYVAGQSAQAPGIVGTVLGSLNTVKLIIGHDLFREKFAGLNKK